MGNVHIPKQFHSPVLLGSVCEELLFLTKWEKSKIQTIYNRYSLGYSLKPHLSSTEFSKFAIKTPLEEHLDVFLKYFQHKKFNSVNILEILSVIITYSDLS